jgi:membrane protease subunit (stomatin/prohibitin family)
MNAYQSNQEWNDLRWGTGMPVTVMIGSNVVELRARGTFSLAVTDLLRLEQQVPDPDALGATVRSLLVQAITDMLGERSSEVSQVAQLTAINAQTVQALQGRLEPKLTLLGLRLKNVVIDTIESV